MTSTVHKRVISDIRNGRINLLKEFGIHLAPEETDYYKVHFVFPGPPDTPFEGGLYHGMIRLNQMHPMGAPNIHMFTPSGRFNPEPYPIPNGSRGICTTTSAFHPESWTPMNNLETVIKGFISLMADLKDVGIGGMTTSVDNMKRLAKKSIDEIKSDIVVKELFPELYKEVCSGKYKSFVEGKNTDNVPVKEKEKSQSESYSESESEDNSESEPEMGSESESESESSSESETESSSESESYSDYINKRKRIRQSDEEIHPKRIVSKKCAKPTAKTTTKKAIKKSVVKKSAKKPVAKKLTNRK